MKPINQSKAVVKRAFTLMELLVVVVIILVLVGLVLPAVHKSIVKAEQARARETVSQLTAAMNAYFHEFGRWPTTATGAPYQDSCIPTNYFDNASGIVIYTAAPKDVGSNTTCTGMVNLGVLLDPWKAPYHLRVNLDYSGTVPDPLDNSVTIRQGFAIWSDGPNGASDTGGDDSALNKDNPKSW